MKTIHRCQHYDPRLAQDYRTYDHRSRHWFSSHEHGLYLAIIETTQRSDLFLSNLMEAMLQCLPDDSSRGFASVSPWYPGAAAIRANLSQEFPDLISIGSSLVVQISAFRQAASSLLRIRAEHGGDSSGEWAIGSFIEHLDPSAVGSDLGTLLAQADKLQTLIWLGENQQTWFVSRSVDVAQRVVAGLCADR